MPGALHELEDALSDFAIPVSELVYGGGGEAKELNVFEGANKQRLAQTQRLKSKRSSMGKSASLTSHVVDHVKKFAGNTIALEIEWNNKDPSLIATWRTLNDFTQMQPLNRKQSSPEGSRSRRLAWNDRRVRFLEGISDMASLSKSTPYASPTCKDRARGQIQRLV